MSDLSVLIDQYARNSGTKPQLIQILHEIDRLLHVENPPSDPSVPNKVWVVHYSDYLYATFDEGRACSEVGNGHAERYSGPYRLVSA